VAAAVAVELGRRGLVDEIAGCTGMADPATYITNSKENSMRDVMTRSGRDGPSEVERSDEIGALDEAIATLDAVWDFDAARGAADGLGGAEYRRRSPVPRLRELRARLAHNSKET
jgi:hypothetical protein